MAEEGLSEERPDGGKGRLTSESDWDSASLLASESTKGPAGQPEAAGGAGHDDDQEAIINPRRGRRAPDVGPMVVMVSGGADVDNLRRALWVAGGAAPGRERGIETSLDIGRPLMMSRVYPPAPDGLPVAVAGPVVGAPYATLMLEALIAWGARRILYLGYCGAIGPHVKIGDIVAPTAARIDEGVSRHYDPDAAARGRCHPPGSLTDEVLTALEKAGTDFHAGEIWTTDAVYRETRGQVRRLQAEGALGVEMELSALFTVGRYRSVSVAGLLVVSDELSSLEWNPGFKSERFRAGREKAVRLAADICREWAASRPS